MDKGSVFSEDFQNLNDLDSNPDWDEIFSEQSKSTPSLNTENRINSFISTLVLTSLTSQLLNINLNNIEPANPFIQDLNISQFSTPNRTPNILNQFADLKKKKRRAELDNTSSSFRPKKEYFRIKLVRGHKRIIRFILSHPLPITEFPSKTINKYSQKQSIFFENLASFVHLNKEVLNNFSKTSNGPLTDGESYFKKIYGEDFKKHLDIDKTFNNKFCNSHFSNFYVFESFKLYVKYLFGGQDSNDLRDRFGLECCTENVCECREGKWKLLEDYCANKLLFSSKSAGEILSKVREEEIIPF